MTCVMESTSTSTGTICEEWREVEGFEARYSVSNLGRVKVYTFLDKLGRERRGQILNPYLDKRGYPRVTLQEGGQKATAKSSQTSG